MMESDSNRVQNIKTYGTSVGERRMATYQLLAKTKLRLSAEQKTKGGMKKNNIILNVTRFKINITNYFALHSKYL